MEVFTLLICILLNELDIIKMNWSKIPKVPMVLFI